VRNWFQAFAFKINLYRCTEEWLTGTNKLMMGIRNDMSDAVDVDAVAARAEEKTSPKPKRRRRRHAPVPLHAMGYVRGACSPDVRQHGNLHALARPLRAAAYHLLGAGAGIDGAVREVGLYKLRIHFTHSLKVPGLFSTLEPLR
jgi:hypothetical protein